MSNEQEGTIIYDWTGKVLRTTKRRQFRVDALWHSPPGIGTPWHDYEIQVTQVPAKDGEVVSEKPIRARFTFDKLSEHHDQSEKAYRGEYQMRLEGIVLDLILDEPENLEKDDKGVFQGRSSRK